MKPGAFCLEKKVNNFNQTLQLISGYGIGHLRSNSIRLNNRLFNSEELDLKLDS
jgi:hypothetical protein